MKISDTEYLHSSLLKKISVLFISPQVIRERTPNKSSFPLENLRGEGGWESGNMGVEVLGYALQIETPPVLVLGEDEVTHQELTYTSILLLYYIIL